MNVLYHLKKRLKFLLTASNQYGVHSPFVYHFLTNCLYQKSHFNTSKSLNVLLKSMVYFNIQSVAIPGEEPLVKNAIMMEYPDVELYARKPQLLYLDPITSSEGNFLGEKEILQTPSILFINKIYHSAACTKNWETLKMQAGVTITLDFFYCGLIFMRHRQAKEHFKIRI